MIKIIKMNTHLLETELVTKHGMKLFQKWYKEAAKAYPENYMFFCLSTVDKENKPSSRMLCLTGCDDECFRFSTNDNSPKSIDIKSNPNVSMNFFWAPLQKSIRINGIVTRYLKGDEDYSLCPGLQNQITLSAIEFQSQPVQSLETVLEMREKTRLENKYGKCPDFWVTFEVEPSFIEFVQVQPDFCADRLRFYNPRFNVKKSFDEKATKNGDDGWFYCRLLP